MSDHPTVLIDAHPRSGASDPSDTSPAPDRRADPEVLRGDLLALTPVSLLRISLLMVADYQHDPAVYEVPISRDLAVELADQCAQSAKLAAEAELREADPGLRPAPHQWLYSSLPPASRLTEVDEMVLHRAHRQYDRSVDIDRRSLLVLRVRDPAGRDLGRLYQGFAPEKTLQRSKIVALWSGQQFSRLIDEPLVIDRSLRLIVVGGMMAMPTASVYQSLFGALPELRAKAAKTYRATIGTLDIVDGDKLAAACASDINMMRKLVGIQTKLDRPGYAEAVTMPALVEFLKAHPRIGVPVLDADGPSPRLVFSSDAQHRWAILKLLDDDFLRSDLTDITYEANSKTRL